jgi:excisionase family DNA binding protein
MAEYITAKQVIDILKIDRTTLYRMLKEERIKGIKIGSQWRFSSEEITALMEGKVSDTVTQREPQKEILPIHCVQPIQEVFSDIMNVASLTTDNEGNQLTEISNACSFCSIILSSEKGKNACLKSWKELRFSNNGKPVFNTCHAGLNYSGANIVVEGVEAAKLITGQYHISKPKGNQDTKIKSLADKYDLDYKELLKASKKVEVIDERSKSVMGKWLLKIANSFEQMAIERKELLKKLKSIADISNF